MPSTPTELILSSICSILEHMTEQIVFSTPPALLPNFSLYSSTATLDLDALVKSGKEEYLFFVWATAILFPKLSRGQDLAKCTFVKNL